jgi:glutamate synthase (NADPH/NADH) large chain
VIAALLGADELGFSTAPLVVEGCIMMRKCHLNTCPVGVATQDPVLRAKFQGKPEHVVNYFFFVAEEARQIMAQLGIKTFNELIGRTDLLDKSKAITHWKAQGLDFSKIFYQPNVPSSEPRYQVETQDHGLEKALDHKLIAQAKPAIDRGEKVSFISPVKNLNRTVGAMLSGEVAKKYGHEGLPDDTIHIQLQGTAGQSCGAFLAHGVTLDLVGEGNDYVGKGISGGRVIVRPDEKATFASEENVIAGNVIGYGATSGEIYIRGLVGERFCVRNSGATAVVEGVGDHALEYMTGGTVVILGATGRNIAAGMSGGRAFVLDLDSAQVNGDMVDVLAVPADQREILKSIISDFHVETGSKVASDLLASWESSVSRFSMIMPRDYARVLAAIERATKDGLPIDQYVMEVAANG